MTTMSALDHTLIDAGANDRSGAFGVVRALVRVPACPSGEEKTKRKT